MNIMLAVQECMDPLFYSVTDAFCVKP